MSFTCACPGPFPYIGNFGNNCNSSCVPPEICNPPCKPTLRVWDLPKKEKIVKKIDNSCAPKDSLDLKLSGCYDQHRQFLAPKAQTVMQCYTYRLFPWGRQNERLCRLKNLPDMPINSEDLCLPSNLCIVNNEHTKNHSSHINISIGSPHISNSARGYGRSNDGNFYNC